MSQEGDCILTVEYICAKAPDSDVNFSPVRSRSSMFHSKSGLLALQFQRVFQWSGFRSIDGELKLKHTDQATKVGSYAAIVANLPLESPSDIFF